MSDLGPGEKPENVTGIISMVVYLVLLFCFLTYVMVKVWPHCQPDGSAASAQPTPPLSPAATGQPAAAVQPQPPLRLRCPEPAEVTFLWWGPTWIWWEVRLLLIVILSGALGSLVHTLRSIYWYVGNKSLKWSWLSMYVLLPFCGAALALVFYFVVRGGFFVPQGQAVGHHPAASR